jgi:hypothetical protein
MKKWTWALAAAAVVVGCQQGTTAVPTRAELKTAGGSTMQILPKEGQHPYCMVFTVSEKGVIRQLTMTRENRSIKCEPGKPVAHARFRVPVEEGKVKVYIFFTDQRVQAGSVAQQLNDLRNKPVLTAMDFRLPGSASVEVLEFTPQPEAEQVTGAVVTGTTDLSAEEGAEPAGGEVEVETAPPGSSEAAAEGAATAK